MLKQSEFGKGRQTVARHLNKGQARIHEGALRPKALASCVNIHWFLAHKSRVLLRTIKGARAALLNNFWMGGGLTSDHGQAPGATH
jgi:hypothetical protein